ncbi:hypothetical protein H072_2219 [Dactylellina haptotyla CBS 200.50]|uniref:Uncharacterized protein n=1 Tax=Dactylellina haptotyla (strain CBS 200.50) TaxID=1284197 RepID=S8C7S9_DACHA|nr:hypothetical protein H072_2219 [Dactylellina haptotyla CBS 200.50]
MRYKSYITAAIIIIKTHAFEIAFVEDPVTQLHSHLPHYISPQHNFGISTCNSISLSDVDAVLSYILVRSYEPEPAAHDQIEVFVESQGLPFALAFFKHPTQGMNTYGCDYGNLAVIVRYDQTRIYESQIVTLQYGNLGYWQEVLPDVEDDMYGLIQELGMGVGDVGYKLANGGWEIFEDDVESLLHLRDPSDQQVVGIEEEGEEEDMISATEEDITNDWRNVMEGQQQQHSEQSWRRSGFDPDDLEVHPWPLRVVGTSNARNSPTSEDNRWLMSELESFDTRTLAGTEFDLDFSDSSSKLGSQPVGFRAGFGETLSEISEEVVEDLE